MDKFVINGGVALKGQVATSGSKNSALPALAAALLTGDTVTLKAIPKVRDIRTMQRLLVDIGSRMEIDETTVRIETPSIVSSEAPYELVKTMRASSLVLGPLVARSGRARVSLPGGAAPSARAPSTCTSSAWSAWAPASTRPTATSKPRRSMASAAAMSISTASPSPAPRT